jgi:3-oxoacyl-[acyl-carrier protein] reductase
MGLLEADVAVVTGGAQGIGLAIARALVEEGARVVIADLDERSALHAATELNSRAAAHVAVGLACDVTHSDDVRRAVDLAVTEFGRITVMVNNAGFTRDAAMKNMTEEQFDQVIAVHLKGCWNGTRLAADQMREQGSGSIINISSLSGKVGNFGQTNYSAAKAGIIGLTKAAAKETARHGIRVNAIQPGLIRTPMTEAMPSAAWDSKMAEIPLGRAGEPGEVAAVAVFYASSLSSYMTGTVSEVTGGRSM